MTNLIGKSAQETRDNILNYAAVNAMTVLDDREIDSSLKVGVTTMTRYMAISNGKQTVSITVYPDGRITREVR